jgi:hypothetical protein
MSRYRRAYLHPPSLATGQGTGWPNLGTSSQSGDEPADLWQHGPAVAAQAVSGELVVVLEQARDAAEVDHGARVAPGQRQGTSLHTD